MFASPAIALLLEELARRGHASLVKRRLNQFLEGSGVISGAEKYEVLKERLDQALGAPDVDEIGHMNINKIREIFGLGVKALPLRETAAWVDWAVRRRLILRGVQATCPNCKHTQWRPLGDVVPELECHEDVACRSTRRSARRRSTTSTGPARSSSGLLSTMYCPMFWRCAI